MLDTTLEAQTVHLVAMREALNSYVQTLFEHTIRDRGVWNIDNALDITEEQVRIKVETAIEDALKYAYNARQ